MTPLRPCPNVNDERGSNAGAFDGALGERAVPDRASVRRRHPGPGGRCRSRPGPVIRPGCVTSPGRSSSPISSRHCCRSRSGSRHMCPRAGRGNRCARPTPCCRHRGSSPTPPVAAPAGAWRCARRSRRAWTWSGRWAITEVGDRDLVRPERDRLRHRRRLAQVVRDGQGHRVGPERAESMRRGHAGPGRHRRRTSNRSRRWSSRPRPASRRR